MAGDGGSGLSASELAAALSKPINPLEGHKSPSGVQRLARAAFGLLPKTVPEPFPIESEESKSVIRSGGPNALPFEFRALEACLGAACGFLDREVSGE